MDWFRFVVYSLAVYRLTNLFYWENGPGDVFDWIRAKAGIRLAEKKSSGQFVSSTSADATQHWVWEESELEWVREADGFWAKLLNCPLCLSVWFSGLATLGYCLNNAYIDVIVVWLALAAVSLILYGES